MKMKMKMKLNKSIIPISVLILCMLGIYFIIYKKEKEYYDNWFSPILNNNNEHFKNMKQQSLNALTNKDMTMDLANGNWTSDKTEFNKINSLKNYFTVNVDINGNGNVTMNNDVYKINYFGNMKLTAINLNNSNQLIQFKFKPIISNSDDVPTALISIYNNNEITNEYYSFKIFDVDNTGGKLSRIIASKQFYQNINEKYDINTYHKYIGDYRYPHNAIKISYGNITSGKFYDKMEKDYDSKLMIGFKREFYTTGKDTLMTKLSQIYTLKGINNMNRLFSKIEISDIEQEKKLNGIRRGFIPKATHIYVYKMKNVKNNYSFPNSQTDSSKKFNLKNNADKMFSKINVSFPKIGDTLLTIQGNYDLVLVKTISMKPGDNRLKIEIKEKEFESVL